jgi:hypothetical protein
MSPRVFYEVRLLMGYSLTATITASSAEVAGEIAEALHGHDTFRHFNESDHEIMDVAVTSPSDGEAL